jgi:hypothetical protein
MLINEFLREIENTYHKYFNNSRCSARLHTNLYKSMDIACYLAIDINELRGGYWENDIFNIRFTINTENGELEKGITQASEVPENLKIESYQKSYLLKPATHYMAFGSKQLSFRKTKGNYKKILVTLDKFFKQLHEELMKDIEADQIHNNHLALLKTKLNINN